jgi:hypothetical protein
VAAGCGVTDRENDLRRYLDVLYRGLVGWAVVCFGTPQPDEAAGKITHPDFAEKTFSWPRQADALVEFVLTVSEHKDIWITPGLSDNPLRDSKKRKSLPSRYCWAEVDNDPSGLARIPALVELGGFTVNSGRAAGHLHVYLRLAEPADPAVVLNLNQRVAKAVHAGQFSHLGGLLRPVGSFNHKPRLLSPEAKPALVTFDQCVEGDGWPLAQLEALLPPTRATRATRSLSEAAEGEPLPEPVPAQVAAILDDPEDYGDRPGVHRSRRLFALVQACRRCAFTDGQILTAAGCHLPSKAKYGDRLEAEVRRILERLAPDDEPQEEPGSSISRRKPRNRATAPPAMAAEQRILTRFAVAARGCGLVGERATAQLLYLVITSRLLDKPVSLGVKGHSSSGKSFVVETTCRVFPREAVVEMTAMSQRALVYSSENYRHRMLVLYEVVALREGVEDDLTAYFVRSLLL